MHRCVLLVRSWNLFAALLLTLLSTANGQTKLIRLRNETIFTEAKTNVAQRVQPFVAQAPASGLFLIQFNTTLKSSERAQLGAAGVELVKYVPDDAFIAKFSQASPDRVRAMSFVRWVGSYRPDHKVHPRLLAALRSPAPAPGSVSVTALLSRSSTAAEVAAVRSIFSSIDHESRLRLGTILRGQLDPGHLDALAQADAVLWVEPAPQAQTG